MQLRLSLIVEGVGEVQAAPILVRRLVQALAPGTEILIPHPIRIPKTRLLRPGELERAVELAARTLGGGGGVCVLLDADDDCPATLGPELLERARSSRADLEIIVVVAKLEFESWFLAAARSLRGVRDLPTDLDPPADPEGIRGAKEWLSRQMTGRRNYHPSRDQAALAARINLSEAERAPSFAKLRREIARLVRA